MDPAPRLTFEQIAALRPFLRCLATSNSKGWVLEMTENLRIDHFVALHYAFRPFLTFSDVYSDEPPREKPDGR